MKGRIYMGCLGNLLWFLICGFWIGMGWVVCGILWCISIIGIPVGVQCFKFAGLAFFPFGKDVVYGGGTGSFLMNIVWLIFGGIEITLVSVVIGCVLCCTIIGIPFGLQCFKLAKLSLMPFGAEITYLQ